MTRKNGFVAYPHHYCINVSRALRIDRIILGNRSHKLGQDQSLPPTTLVILNSLIIFYTVGTRKNIVIEFYNQIACVPTLVCIHQHVVY